VFFIVDDLYQKKKKKRKERAKGKRYLNTLFLVEFFKLDGGTWGPKLGPAVMKESI